MAKDGESRCSTTPPTSARIADPPRIATDSDFSLQSSLATAGNEREIIRSRCQPFNGSSLFIRERVAARRFVLLGVHARFRSERLASLNFYQIFSTDFLGVDRSIDLFVDSSTRERRKKKRKKKQNKKICRLSCPR